MADRVYRSANWSGVGQNVSLKLLRDQFYDGAVAVKLDVGDLQYIITERGTQYPYYEEHERIEKAYDLCEKTLNLLFSSGVKVAPLAPKIVGDVDIVTARGPAGYYTLRRRDNGTLYVHVKSVHSGATYTVAKNPETGAIESTDKGFIFNGSSKHTEFVKSKGWL